MNRFTPTRWTFLIVLWQLVSVYLMAVGVWGREVVYINSALLAVFFLFAKPLDALKLFIVSIPFYVVIPNDYSDTLSMWRPLLVWLSVIVFIKSGHISYVISKLKKVTSYKLQVTSLLAKPDFYFLVFIALALISTFIAHYPSETIKQIIFLLNAYLVYIVVRLAVQTKEQAIQLAKSVLLSVGLIIALGFVQYIATFFAPSYYFWQYWATMVSSLYYGQSLADVLIYSNSWFSYTGGVSSLRMFSIMPDSHSFALVCALAFLLSLPFLTLRKKARAIAEQIDSESSAVALAKADNNEPDSELFSPKNTGWFRALAIASGLSIIFAGTRGVWVGMLAPFVIALVLYIKKIFKPLSKKVVVGFVLIMLFFVVSPYINQGVNLIRSGALFGGSFLDRAQSIYDLSEQSNVGRLQIWKESAVYALQHPLGTGYHNFIVSLFHDIPAGTSIEQLGSLENTRYNLPQKFVTAHSLYLHLLVELGVLGLLAFVAWLLTFLYRCAKYLWLNRSEFALHQQIVFTIALFVIWVLAHGVFDLTIFNDKILLYLFSVLAIAALLTKDASPQKET